MFFSKENNNWESSPGCFHTATPKWMVKIMETPIKMDDLEVKTPPIFGSTPISLTLPETNSSPLKIESFFGFLWFANRILAAHGRGTKLLRCKYVAWHRNSAGPAVVFWLVVFSHPSQCFWSNWVHLPQFSG